MGSRLANTASCLVCVESQRSTRDSCTLFTRCHSCSAGGSSLWAAKQTRSIFFAHYALDISWRLFYGGPGGHPPHAVGDHSISWNQAGFCVGFRIVWCVTLFQTRDPNFSHGKCPAF